MYYKRVIRKERLSRGVIGDQICSTVFLVPSSFFALILIFRNAKNKIYCLLTLTILRYSFFFWGEEFAYGFLCIYERDRLLSKIPAGLILRKLRT
eukprot:snap_masked-scaffold_51-processed-gene-0.27-mRNA-1 protein AED:1.00 eAED:1.00 QI:0/0/0/0/1/1/2/0/94